MKLLFCNHNCNFTLQTEGSNWLSKWSKDVNGNDDKHESTAKPVNVQRIRVVNARSNVNDDAKQ